MVETEHKYVHNKTIQNTIPQIETQIETPQYGGGDGKKNQDTTVRWWRIKYTKNL